MFIRGGQLRRAITAMTEPIVTTKLGRLRGARAPNIDGGSYLAFKGIPYAKPPVGRLRFSDPEPAEPWTGVRSALEHGDMAVQRDMVTRDICGSEDCLYLNVYTNSIGDGASRPVMVWIHGGAFVYGSGHNDMYSPDYLLKHDVVIVTLNYRLGVLGFLNFEDETAPGNQGLKDQVLALEWIRENISSFGGDAQNVTVFGESAGGASVHYLALSPLSKGLFHKAIAQSGVCLNHWAYIPGRPSYFAFKLCEILGLKSKNPKILIEKLKNFDFAALVEAQDQIMSLETRRVYHPFGPTVDSKSNRPFMLKDPNTLARSLVGVPFLLGHNSLEGALLVAGKKKKDYEKINSNIKKVIHPTMQEILAKKNIKVEDFRRRYYGNEDVSIKNTEKYAKMCSEMNFDYGILEVWKIQSKSPAPTYCYKFSYDSTVSFFKTVFNLGYLSGACHTDELDYLFHQPIRSMISLEPLTPGSSAYRIMQKMTKMWTNFAKTGNPTPEVSEEIPIVWPAIEPSELHYLNINEDLRVESLPINYDLLNEIASLISKL